MKNDVTTTTKGFRVVDITFKNARKQSEILDELPEESVEDNTTVPVSTTPEQIIKYYKSKIEGTRNAKERKVYEVTIQWIEERFALDKKCTELEQKIDVYRKATEVREENSEDIEE